MARTFRSSPTRKQRRQTEGNCSHLVAKKYKNDGEIMCRCGTPVSDLMAVLS